MGKLIMENTAYEELARKAETIGISVNALMVYLIGRGLNEEKKAEVNHV